MLCRLDEELTRLGSDRDGDGSGADTALAGVREIADELSDILLSHFSYGEDQLAGGLSVRTETT